MNCLFAVPGSQLSSLHLRYFTAAAVESDIDTLSWWASNAVDCLATAGQPVFVYASNATVVK